MSNTLIPLLPPFEETDRRRRTLVREYAGAVKRSSMEAIMVDDQSLIPVGYIQQLIFWIRGQRVMLDADLAKIYGVSTTRLNQQVSRNRGRFPEDFMFQLTRGEFDALMLQFATSKAKRGGRRKLPYAFTEHGAIMLAAVLNSPAAVRASVQVVRAFVQLRRLLTSHGELARKLTDLERTLLRHDSQFKVVFDTIRQLMSPPRLKRRRIGFGARNP